MIIAIFIFVLVLGICLAVDYHKWLSHEDINHTIRFFYRIVFLLPTAVGLTVQADNDWYKVLPVVYVMLGFAWVNLFDGIYNVLRSYGWYFNGSRDEQHDSKIDRFWMALPNWLEACLKIGGFLAAVFTYYKML